MYNCSMLSVRRSTRKRKPSSIIQATSNAASKRVSVSRPGSIYTTAEYTQSGVSTTSTSGQHGMTLLSLGLPNIPPTCTTTTASPMPDINLAGYSDPTPMGYTVQNVPTTTLPTQSQIVSGNQLGNTINFTDLSTLPQPQQIMSTRFDLGLNVSQSLKEKIHKSEYVELALLLANIQSNSNAAKFYLYYGELVLRPDISRKKITSIEQWTSAFIIFSSIYCSVHPNRFNELLKYMHIIRLGAERSSLGWRYYDEQFRLRKVQNPSSSWSEVDSELWLFYMQGNNSTNELAMTNNTSLNRNNLKCYAFNYVGSCYKQGCSYSHTCIHCGAGHSVKVCHIKQGHSRHGLNDTGARQSNRNYALLETV